MGRGGAGGCSPGRRTAGARARRGGGRWGGGERCFPLPRGGISSARSPRSARTKILGVKRRLGGAAGSEARGQARRRRGSCCPPRLHCGVQPAPRRGGPRRGGLQARPRSPRTRLPPPRAPAPARLRSRGARRLEEGERRRRRRLPRSGGLAAAAAGIRAGGAPPRTPPVPAAGRGRSGAEGPGGPPPPAGSGERSAAPPSAQPGGRRRRRRGGLAVPPPSEDVALQVRLAGSHLQPHQHGPLAGEDPAARYGGAGAGAAVSPHLRRAPRAGRGAGRPP